MHGEITFITPAEIGPLLRNPPRGQIVAEDYADNVFLAIDNETGTVQTRLFASLDEAICWLVFG